MDEEFTDKELYIASKHVKNCFHLRDTPQNRRFKQSWESLGPSKYHIFLFP